MKKLFIAASMVCAMASQAYALSIGDSQYVGSVVDGIPSNPAAEVGYINNLIDLAPGAGNTVCGTETCNRQNSTLDNLPDAVLAGAGGVDNPPSTTIDATGFAYVLGKYDASQAGSLVWYLGDDFSGNVTLPSTFNGLGLSHIGLYNAVPEPTSLLLLGSGLLGLLGYSWHKDKRAA